MATSYSPSIIHDKLVFCVDAENKKSYPGSGTTWKDIASNTDNVDFQSTTLHSSGKYFTLSSGYIRWTDIGPKIAGQGDGTISMWWSNSTGAGNDSIINTGDFSTNWNLQKMSIMWNHTTSKLSVYCYADSTTAVIAGDFGNALSTNTLYNIVWSSTGHLYVNGSLHANLSNTWWFDNMTGHDYFMFGGVALNNAVYGDQKASGKLYNITIHNKAFSASEVLQNFNAQRRRFGV